MTDYCFTEAVLSSFPENLLNDAYVDLTIAENSQITIGSAQLNCSSSSSRL